MPKTPKQKRTDEYIRSKILDGKYYGGRYMKEAKSIFNTPPAYGRKNVRKNTDSTPDN